MTWLLILKVPLLVLQAIVTPILILFVMLQSGKGDDMSALAGAGGGSSSVLGTGGASKILTRGTAILAIIFMINCVALAKIFREEGAASIGGAQPEPIMGTPAPAAPVDGGAAAPAQAPADQKSEPSSAEPKK
jgi:preprotein translocase subunit SecG